MHTVVSIPRLKIMGVGYHGDKEEIKQKFSKFGSVRDVWITTNPPACAYVVYETLQDAERAVKIMDGKRLCGACVTVQLSPSEDRREREQDMRGTQRYPSGCQRGDQLYHTSRSHSCSQSRIHSHSRSRSRSPIGAKRSSKAYSPSSNYGGRQSRKGGSSSYCDTVYSRKHYSSKAPSVLQYEGTTVTENEAYTTVLSCHDKLVSALSPDTHTIAGILMENGFIPPEIHAEMLLLSSPPHVKTTNLVNAIMEKIKIAPKRFHELIKIFSEQKWTTDIAEILQSAYQGK